jgi:hypothetical protein
VAAPDSTLESPALVDEFKEFIHKLLPDIDQYLSDLQVPPKQRLLRAGIIIVKDFVISVSGDANKEDYSDKPWFAILYYHIENWYRDHYGTLLDENKSGFARGVIIVRDLPVELKVPLTRGEVETHDKTAWLYFPIEVHPIEEPLKWLVGGPRLDKLSTDALDKVRSDAARIATALRSVWQFTNGVEPSDTIIDGFLGGILAEMESAAAQILRNESKVIGNALWSMQMACERVLKAFSQQRVGSFRETHDLFVLFDDAASQGLVADRLLLKTLPRVDDAVSARYGLGSAMAIAESVDAYKAALSLIVTVAKALHRRISFAEAGILFSKPPWLSLPDLPTSASSEV